LEEIVEQAGHKIIFFPKYHCELNFIESFWGAAKKYARQNCNYSWESLNQIVPDALDSVSLNKIRKFARRSYRYMSAYRLGLPCKAAIYAIKKYRSHRKIPENILTDFDI
jgi:transposase